MILESSRFNQLEPFLLPATLHRRLILALNHEHGVHHQDTTKTPPGPEACGTADHRRGLVLPHPGSSRVCSGIVLVAQEQPRQQ